MHTSLFSEQQIILFIVCAFFKYFVVTNVLFNDNLRFNENPFFKLGMKILMQVYGNKYCIFKYNDRLHKAV